MIVVSDTSAISNLFIIGELELLRKIYSEILLPKAVMNELIVLEKSGVNIDSIRKSGWIKIIEVTQRSAVNQLLIDLDLGEAEAIVLAKHINADWLLIDETKGRHIAKESGLQTIGLLVILLLAKREGMINEIKSFVDRLMIKAKFRISNELYDRILVLANE